MTYKEAWSLIAPILAQYLDSGSTYIEAYATVFSALHKLDGKEGEGE